MENTGLEGSYVLVCSNFPPYKCEFLTSASCIVHSLFLYLFTSGFHSFCSTHYVRVPLLVLMRKSKSI